MRASLLLCGLLCVLAARPARAEGEAVQAVRIEGLKTVSEPFLRSRIRTAPGTPFSESVLDEDVGRIYQTGYFSEVRLRRESVPGGLLVVIEVVENPLVSEVVLRGNHAFSDSKLMGRIRSAVRKDRGEIRYVEQADIDLDVKAITNAYREKAYLFARVQSRLEPGEGGERLVFEIEEGRKVPVRRITFRGHHAYDHHWPSEWRVKKIKKGAPVLTKKKLIFFNDGALDLEVLQDDADRIKDFYRANGWLDATVRASHQMDLQRQRTEVTFEVTEGERYRIGTVALSGNALLDAKDLLPRFRTQSGKPYRLQDVLHDQDAIRAAYGDLGHLVTQATPRYHYDAVGKAVDVTFEIQEGPKVRIRRIEVEGNARTRDKILRRQMTVYPGDLFNYTKLQRSQKKLQNLRYFKTIQMRMEEAEDESERDLILQVEEDKTGSFNYGAGFSDDAGLFGILRISQSNFDSADLRGFPWNTKDFFFGDSYVGGGQSFSVSATPGQRVTSYDLAYYEPWLYDRPIGLGFNLFHRTRDFLDYSTTEQGGTLTLNRRIGERWTVGNVLTIREVRVSGVAEDAPQSLKDSEGSFSVNSLTPYVAWDTRDDPFMPSTGQFNRVSYEHAGAPLFGGVDFWRLSDDYSCFWTLKKNEDEQRKHILSFGARAGMIEGHSDTGDEGLPVDLKYFAGGASTLRGFNYHSVSPRENDVAVGGRFILLTNVEYTYPLYEEILRGAVFVDRGTVAIHVKDPDLLNGFRSAYGFGLRIQLPISPMPISLDVAFPLEEKDGDSTRVFTFNFGTIF